MTKTGEMAQDHRVQHRSEGFHVPHPQCHKGNPPRSHSDPQYAAGMSVDDKKIIYSEEEKITP